MRGWRSCRCGVERPATMAATYAYLSRLGLWLLLWALAARMPLANLRDALPAASCRRIKSSIAADACHQKAKSPPRQEYLIHKPFDMPAWSLVGSIDGEELFYWYHLSKKYNVILVEKWLGDLPKLASAATGKRHDKEAISIYRRKTIWSPASTTSFSLIMPTPARLHYRSDKSFLDKVSHRRNAAIMKAVISWAIDMPINRAIYIIFNINYHRSPSKYQPRHGESRIDDMFGATEEIRLQPSINI